ncbi:natural resistance-associated macrophage protein-domain-containing protein [Radiomyces spectabilis]|uniref:natural resistance-associated macrophage protein-domain-containing protein n=1 Tax=Radiomyces spectabilis TaxID=64574 RepID=UPI00221E5A9A|nr:natural resistance-associated macrophage protein-domain-containing protein [Radiomyces spectabilis]KAI8376418.1 natural resistance-associated macrophage protein-domain-containing protein [Radiomyces spectabilis]
MVDCSSCLLDCSSSAHSNNSTVCYQACSNDTTTNKWDIEVDVKGQVDTGADSNSQRFSFSKLMQSIAYLDPGNLESDLQSGAIAGYKLLWLLFWAHAAGLAIQILSARLGVVTGNHLAQLIRQSYSRPISFVIWLFTQFAIIGSDIQEIIGTAIALKIFFGFSLWVGVLITATDTFLFMWLQQYGVRKIEVFFMVLIGVMVGCFWAEMFASHPSIRHIVEGILIPEIPEQATVQAVGMVGAVIMPHNMFLHSALVMSRNLGEKPTVEKKKEANFYFAVESGLALLTSYFINLAIVVVFAQVFYAPDRDVLQLPGLYDASDVLRRTLGEGARYLWAAGLLAAGQSSTMTGTLAGQYVVEGFFGAIFKKQWHRVALTRAIALVPSMLVAVLAVKRFDTMGEILNVLQSLCLPTAIIPILKLTASSNIMTSTFKNSKRANMLYWLISWIVIGFNVYLFVSYLKELSWPPVLVLLTIGYFAFVVYLVYLPVDRVHSKHGIHHTEA